MKAKLALLVGAAAGYVLGTRAGRERYEQIKGTATDLWQNNQVQERVSGAESFVTSKAPDMQHKVTEAAKSAVGSARSKFGRGDEDLTDGPSLSESDVGRCPGSSRSSTEEHGRPDHLHAGLHRPRGH